MPPRRTRVLYVTDLGYEARGRRYGDEDVYLSSRLSEHLDVALCHPRGAVALMGLFDVVVVRNSGPVIHYRDTHEEFRAAASATGARVFTQLSGKADMVGKGYLLELFDAGYPVIATVGRPEDLDRLPSASEYVAKPLHGADSVGLRFLACPDLAELSWTDLLVQPRIDFEHEVSFYFVDRTFCYALHAPDPEQRWVLEPWDPSPEDLAFAQQFVDWNDVGHGIQRVDACRTRSGELLLVELEDLNPYLSLDRVPGETRDAFIAAMIRSVQALALVDR